MNLNDPHDMIILLLRALHEDLNRVKETPSNLDFSEKGDDESDQQCADRWWNNFLQRENSIVTDLFYGQFKTCMRCPDCKNTQITFEPYLSLGIPIGERSDSRARFKVFTNDFKYEFFQIEITEVDKFTSVKDLKSKAKEKIGNKVKEFDVLLLKDKEVVKILPDDELIYDHVFQRIDFTQEVFIDWEIILWEVEHSSLSKNKGETVTFYVCPYNLIKENYLYFLTNETKYFLCYPRAFCMPKKEKLRYLYIEVFCYFRRIMENIEGTNFEEFYENILNKKYVEEEFNAYFAEPKDKTLKESNELKEIKEKKKKQNSENDEEEDDEEEEEKEPKTYKEPFFLYLSNNIPPSKSYFTTKQKCEYCNSHCQQCLIKFDENITIYEFLARQKTEREFIVHADFNIFKSNFKKFYFENTDYDDPILNCNGDISVYECLEQFSKESKIEKDKDKDKEKIKDLEKENMFYCKYCRKNLKGLKKVEIYRNPNILIIQLKRFKLKVASLMELVQNRKNEAHVDFQGYLDLSRFVLGADKENAKYELIAVCQHTGKMGAGKYSAIARHIKNNTWYQFTDENFKEIYEEEISNPNAYLLVFRKIEKTNNNNSTSTNADANNANNNITSSTAINTTVNSTDAIKERESKKNDDIDIINID